MALGRPRHPCLDRQKAARHAASPYAIFPSLLVASALLAGCSSTPEDKTAGWSTPPHHAEARDEMSGGAYDKAVPLLEKLEGRAAGTALAQQAQLDKAYAQYKTGNKRTGYCHTGAVLEAPPRQPCRGLRAVL